LDKLAEQQVPKSISFNNDSVTSWWRTQYSADSGIVVKPEKYYSNWYPIIQLPQNLYCYDGVPSKKYKSHPLHWPGQQIGNRFLTFADPEHFKSEFDIVATRDFRTDDVLKGFLDERFIPKSEAKKVISYLLVDNWVRMMHQRQMMVYQLSNHRFCGALKEGQVKDDKVFFSGIDGKSAWRGLVGFKTLGRLESEKRLRKWHFGVQAKSHFFPVPAYVISHHVVFSDDGKTPWADPVRQHKARRNQCRSWWNDDWRDRILALMHWLGEGSEHVIIDCGGSTVEVSTTPSIFTSPVSFVGEADSIASDADEREAASYISDDDEDSDDEEAE
jgi:hypothetical protein